MKLNTSARYALAAVGYLGDNDGDEPVMALRVSKEYDIPLEYLLKILQQLVKAEILTSKRGPRGGFMLGRDAKDISLFEVFAAIGVNKPSVDLAEVTSNADFGAKMNEVCNHATQVEKEVYGNAKLADMY